MWQKQNVVTCPFSPSARCFRQPLINKPYILDLSDFFIERNGYVSPWSFKLIWILICIHKWSYCQHIWSLFSSLHMSHLFWHYYYYCSFYVLHCNSSPLEFFFLLLPIQVWEVCHTIKLSERALGSLTLKGVWQALLGRTGGMWW